MLATNSLLDYIHPKITTRFNANSAEEVLASVCPEMVFERYFGGGEIRPAALEDNVSETLREAVDASSSISGTIFRFYRLNARVPQASVVAVM